MGTFERGPMDGVSADLAVGQPPKPLLRGWLHVGAAVASVGLTALLLLRCREDFPRLVSMAVFGLSTVVLYSVSATYHVGRWPSRQRAVLRALDHANIFFLIAGTYTPICVNVLSGPLRLAMLGLVWTLAIFGVATAVLAFRLPRWAYTGLYVAMGWVSLIPFPTLARLLPWQPLVLLVGGGALYTLGAVVYARKRPDPFPQVFGFHEVFHSFVIAGSTAFATAIWVWVVPFPRA